MVYRLDADFSNRGRHAEVSRGRLIECVDSNYAQEILFLYMKVGRLEGDQLSVREPICLDAEALWWTTLENVYRNDYCNLSDLFRDPIQGFGYFSGSWPILSWWIFKRVLRYDSDCGLLGRDPRIKKRAERTASSYLLSILLTFLAGIRYLKNLRCLGTYVCFA